MATTQTPLYAASASVGFGTTLNALATSSTRVAGVQSDEIDNSATLYDDIFLSGTFKAGTSPTAAKQIDVWVVACKDGSSTYPDVITNAGAAAKTWTSENVRNSAAKQIKALLVDATTGRVYELSNESIKALFGYMPKKFVVFVAHDTAVALDASAGGSMTMQGINLQAA